MFPDISFSTGLPKGSFPKRSTEKPQRYLHKQPWPGLVSLWFIWSFSTALISCVVFWNLCGLMMKSHLSVATWHNFCETVAPNTHIHTDSEWMPSQVLHAWAIDAPSTFLPWRAYLLCVWKKLTAQMPRAMLRNKARVFQGYSYWKLLVIWWRTHLQSKWGSPRAAKLQTTAHLSHGYIYIYIDTIISHYFVLICYLSLVITCWFCTIQLFPPGTKAPPWEWWERWRPGPIQWPWWPWPHQ